MGPRWLSDALSGKVSLSRAVWLYGLGISVVYSAVGLFVDLQNLVAVAVYLVVGAALGVLQSVVLWRSAYNTRSRLLGKVVRVVLVLGLLFVALAAYLLYANAGLLLEATQGPGQ